MATAVLSAVFKAVDEMSSVFDKIANTGSHAVEQWERAGDIADVAFTAATTGANQAASAMEKVTSSQDNWTTAVGAYDKSALEAVFSTQELVDMGLKSVSALEEEAEMMRLCTQAGEYLNQATEASVSIQAEMAQAAAEAAQMMDKVADADKGSAESKEELTRATENFNEVVRELAKAEQEATKASEQLAQATGTAGTSQQELEKAAERAAHAAEALAQANGKASQATAELSDATQKCSDEFEDNGKSGADSVKAIEGALVAAGLTKLVAEITGAVVEMANAFSEAESIVVKATGATGSALDSLSDSMMRVYASTKDGDLSNVAGAVGEINTRLGLVGQQLEHSTELFMEYARITDSDVVGAVQNVTKVMKNWGVEVQNTQSLMDMLSYGAQASGVSVDSLSSMVVRNKATLQQLGYSLEESIALISMMEYEGLNASSVMMGFQSAVKQFADQGADASLAMQETIQQIKTMSSESQATALAIEVFGSRAGPEMAYAVRNGKFEIEQWSAAVGGSAGTLKSTAEAATTMEQKWVQASNSMRAAFSSTITPAVNGVSSALADAVQGFGDFLGKCPIATAVLTGLAVGLTSLTATLALYKVATTLGTVVTAVFGTTLQVALWPITIIVAVIAGLVAGLILLFKWLENSNKEFNALSATSKQNQEQLQDLNAEYERTVALQGENSQAARALAEELEMERAAFEATKMTMEEFIAECDNVAESHREMVDQYRESMQTINKEEKEAAGLIAKLAQLSSQTNLTATQQRNMSAIVSALNEKMPNLALAYDKATGKLNLSTEAVKELAKAQYEQQKQQAEQEAYLSALEQQLSLSEQLAIAEEQLHAAQERRAEIGGAGWFGASKQAAQDLETTRQKYDELNQAMGENNRMVEQAESAWGKQNQAIVTYDEAVSISVQGVSESLNVLAQDYDKAYEAAKKTLEGTFGLFEKVEVKAGISKQKMMEAWESQIKALGDYENNLKMLEEFDIDPEFMKTLSNGSPEMIAQAQTMMKELSSMSTEEAEKYVKEYNEKFAELGTARDSVATTMADIQTEFQKRLNEIHEILDTSVEEMNMEEEARQSAKATIDAYIANIRAGVSGAASAGAAVAKAAERALSTGLSAAGQSPILSTTSSSSGGFSLPGLKKYLPGFAQGTESAPPGLAMVGEKGPELINFAGGEAVYPHEETNRMLTAAGRKTLHATAPAEFGQSPSQQGNTPVVSEKRIRLDINGDGEIEVKGALDEQELWRLLQSNLKPVLMGILTQEIYEEGDRSYEF